MEKQKIEETLLNNYKKIAPVFSLIILALYILNVNNHYKLFLDEDKKLRNEIKSVKYDYNAVAAFVKKIFKYPDLVGIKNPLFEKHLSGENYKIAAVIHTKSATAINSNILRIIKNIKNENNDIKIVMFSDGKNNKTNFIQTSSDELSFIEHSGIFLLGNKNHILSVFSLEGTESKKELQLISNYILKIAPEQE